MGRMKTMARLLTAVTAFGLILWQFERFSGAVSHRRPREGMLVGVPLRDATRIDIEFTNAKEVVLEAGSDGWSIVGPPRMRASTPAVMELLDSLEFARRDDFIDSHEMTLRGLTLGDFGLAPSPRGSIRVTGRHLDLKLVAGDCDPFTNGLFVAFDMSSGRGGGVYVTDASLRSVFLKSPEDFADKRVFPCDMSLVHTVILRRPSQGDIKLARSGRHQWDIINGPSRARADWAAVGRLFDVLASATVVDDYRAGATPAKASLDRVGAASAALFSKNDFAGRTLFIGDPVPGDGDLAYAMYPDGGAITVTGALRRAVLLSDEKDFRDRSLFPATKAAAVQTLSIESADHHLSLRRAGKEGWALAAPVAAAADPDAVADLNASVLSLKADELADFKSAVVGPRVATASVELSSGRVAFEIYGAAPDEPARMGILPEGSSTLFLVPAANVSNLLASCANPIPLLSRTVIAVKEEEVRSVTVSRPGAFEDRVVRSSGKWTSAEAGREVDDAAVLRFFASAAFVKAKTVAALAPTNAMPAEGFAEIAFDMADGASLRRILSIGPRIPDGHYACVKGHDTVFLISHETASALAQPLFIPEVAAPAGEPIAPPPAGKDTP